MTDIQQFVEAADDTAPYVTASGFSDYFSQIYAVAELGRLLPPWWSRDRDAAMSRAWRNSTLLSTLMFPAQTKIASMPIRVTAVDPSVETHRRMAEELTQQFTALSQFGEGLQAAMEAFAEDYFGTDNGGHMEVVAEGNKSEPVVGIPYGLRHLDSLHVSRMSDPIHPIRYYSNDGEQINFHHSRVISFAQMRSARRQMNGVGFCAISRTIEIAEKYRDYLNYTRGKMGGRAFKRMIVAKNMAGKELMKAIAASIAMQQEIGGLETETIAIGGMDLEANVLDLANFEQLSEQETTFVTMALMALGWGLEFNEVFPIVGSKASEEIALQRSRGRLPALFVSKFERLASAKLVPAYLRVEIDYVDDYLDQQREIIADIRARNLQRLVEAGVMSPQAARNRLYQDRYISDTTYLNMSLEDGVLPDGTPPIRALFDSAYDDILVVDSNFALGQADREEVSRQVQANRAVIYRLFSLTTSPVKHDRYRIALRALDDLMALYATPTELQTPPRPGTAAPQQDASDSSGVREEPTSTKEFVQKSSTDAERHRDRFRKEILAALTRPGGPDQDELTDKMETAMVVAALLATGRDELEPEDRAAIRIEMELLSSSMASIVARGTRKMDMGPTADRMAGRVMSVYWGTLLHTGVMEDRAYKWTFGGTIEHCTHCALYESLGPKPAEFWQKVAAEEGHYPGSPALECSGIHCMCSLV